MRFEVKAGRAFDGEFSVVVEVEPDKKSASVRKVLIGTAIGAASLLVLIAIGYAVSTGNYAILKTIAQYGKELLAVAVKAAMKSE